MVQIQMLDGAGPSDWSMDQINSVDDRMTEGSWEDKSRQEEYGALPSGNFSHPAQVKCSLGKQLDMERCIDAKAQMMWVNTATRTGSSLPLSSSACDRRCPQRSHC